MGSRSFSAGGRGIVVIAALVAIGTVIPVVAQAVESASVPPVVAVETPVVPGGLVDPCAQGSRLVRWVGGRQQVLTAGFAAACDPAIDGAARELYFTGKKSEGGWAVWQLTLDSAASSAAQRLTPTDWSCRQPAPLPGGGVAVSCGGDLFRVDPSKGGASPDRLTASGGRLTAPRVMPDGRLMARYAVANGADRLLAMLPDGTWATPWRDGGFSELVGFRPWAPDKLLLTLSQGRLEEGSLAEPFVGLRHLSVGRRWQLRDPDPLADGSLVAAARRGRTRPFALVRLAAGSDSAPERLAATPGVHLLQPVAVEPRSAPAVLPSIVKPKMGTGYLVLFDAARSDDPALANLNPGDVAAVRLFAWEKGVASAGAVDLTPEEDGSLYLEVPADRPLGMALITKEGRVLPTVGGPFWVRPNERRACLGCHVSARFAPPDIRPVALTGPAHKVALQAAHDKPPAADKQETAGGL